MPCTEEPLLLSHQFIQKTFSSALAHYVILMQSYRFLLVQILLNEKLLIIASSTDDNPHTGGRAAVSLAPAMAGKINIIYLFIYLFIYL